MVKNHGSALHSERPDQKGTEEYETDEVAIRELRPTASLVVWGGGERVYGGVLLTLLASQARKHNLLPGLPCCTPAGQTTQLTVFTLLGFDKLRCLHVYKLCPPEEQHQCAEECLKVVVLVDVALVI